MAEDLTVVGFFCLQARCHACPQDAASENQASSLSAASTRAPDSSPLRKKWAARLGHYLTESKPYGLNA